jgi:hypothetical protein
MCGPGDGKFLPENPRKKHMTPAFNSIIHVPTFGGLETVNDSRIFFFRVGPENENDWSPFYGPVRVAARSLVWK